MQNKIKKLYHLLMYVLVFIMVGSIGCNAFSTPPKEKFPIYQVGENGYMRLGKYAQLIDEEQGIYKIMLTVDAVKKPKSVNIIFLVNQNGTMKYTTGIGNTRFAVVTEAIKAMLDMFYTDEEIKDYVNLSFQNYALRYDESDSAPTSMLPIYNLDNYPGFVSTPGPPWGGSTNNAIDYIVRNRTPALTSRELSDPNHPTGFAGIDHYLNGDFNNLLTPTSDMRGVDGTNSTPQFAFYRAREIFSQLTPALQKELKYVVFFTDGWNQASASFTQAKFNFSGTPWPTGMPTDVNFVTSIENPNFNYQNLLLERATPNVWWPFQNAVVTMTDLKNGGVHNMNTVSAYNRNGHDNWVNNGADAAGVDPISLKATIWEAEQLKKDDVKIYSIGLNEANPTNNSRFTPDVPNNLSLQMLRETSSGSGYNTVLEVGSTSIQQEMNALFQQIGADIRARLLEGATVHDKISSFFELIDYNGSERFTVTHGEARLENNEIVWDLPGKEIEEGERMILTFYVKAKTELDPELWYPTNEYAYIDWTDPNTNEQSIKYFPVPYTQGLVVNEVISNQPMLRPVDTLTEISLDNSIPINSSTTSTTTILENVQIPIYTPSVTMKPSTTPTTIIKDEPVDDFVLDTWIEN